MGDDRIKHGIRMNPRLFQSLAAKLNRDIRSGAVTVEQIARVANGEDCTLNHPVIASIRAELLAHKVKIL